MSGDNSHPQQLRPPQRRSIPPFVPPKQYKVKLDNTRWWLWGLMAGMLSLLCTAFISLYQRKKRALARIETFKTYIALAYQLHNAILTDSNTSPSQQHKQSLQKALQHILSVEQILKDAQKHPKHRQDPILLKQLQHHIQALSSTHEAMRNDQRRP